VASTKAIPQLVDALVERVLAGDFDAQLVGRAVGEKKGKANVVVQHPASNKKRAAGR
jgi:hypothetical protein